MDFKWKVKTQDQRTLILSKLVEQQMVKPWTMDMDFGGWWVTWFWFYSKFSQSVKQIPSEALSWDMSAQKIFIGQTVGTDATVSAILLIQYNPKEHKLHKQAAPPWLHKCKSTARVALLRQTKTFLGLNDTKRQSQIFRSGTGKKHVDWRSEPRLKPPGLRTSRHLPCFSTQSKLG